MILSILVCTLEGRKEIYEKLESHIHSMINREVRSNLIELVSLCDNRQMTTGEKRNRLLAMAKGKYVVFIDDDDWIPDYYVKELMLAAESDADVFAINGIMTTDGGSERQWFIALNNPYKADYSTGKEVYLRYPNHITPMKRSKAIQFMFPNVTIGEDFDWATRIHNSGILKTEHVIDKPMYHYQYSPTKHK